MVPSTAAVSGQAELHVLALIDHLPLGGAQMLLGQFAAAAPQAAIRLSVACLEDLEGNPAAHALRAQGVDPVNLEVPGRPDADTFRKVRRHIATVRPDLVHTHLDTSDWVGGLTARSLRLPVVSTIHTMEWERDPETQIKRRLVRFCASRIIAVSDSAGRIYASHGWARPRQLATVYNGVDVRAEPGAGRGVRRELGIEPDAHVVCMISSLRPEKGHDVAIDAVRMLRGRFPQLRLLIVGQGGARERIAAHAGEDLGLTVFMPGLRDDVMRCFDAADVCLHPSRADALPTTLIEAMAASVPIIASTVGGIPEMVDDGRTGVLLAAPPSADAIAASLAELLDDPHRRTELGSRAREVYLRRFTAEPWIRSTRDVYDAVLATRRSAQRKPRSELVQQSAGGRIV